MNLLDAPFEVVGSHEFPVQTLKSSPYGLTTLSGDTERNLIVWRDGEQKYRLALRTRNPKDATSDRLRSVEFSPSGDAFYVASGTSVQAYRTEDGSRLWSFTLPRFLGFLVSVPLSLDVDGAGHVAVSSDNGTFGYRDSFGRKMRQWKHNSAPRWIRWVKNGAALVGSDSFSIRLWDAGTGETLRGYSTDERVYNLVAAPEGEIFAVRTLHAVQIYSVDTERPIAEIRTREGLPLMAFSPDGLMLAVSDAHGARVFSVGAQLFEGMSELVFEAELTGDVAALSIAFTADNRGLLIGCSDGNIRRYEVTR